MLDVLLTVFGALLLLEVLRAHRGLRPQAGVVSAPTPARWPSLTIIRPIRGLDAGEPENLRAGLAHGYPGRVDTLFVLDDEQDPAVPFVRAAIAEHEREQRAGDVRLFFVGPPPPGRTGKLNAMIVGLRQARGELVAFSDSDTRPGPGLLTDLVRTLLGAQGAGAAFAPVVVVGRARTAGDVGYALMLNGLYGPEAAALTKRGGGALTFIMGQYMVLRREALAAIGGLECAEGQLVDDMYLGLCMHAAGFRNVVSHERLPIVATGLGLGEFARIYLRWIAFSRSGLPASSKQGAWARGLVFWAGLCGAVAAAMLGAPWAALVCALVPVATSASINALHRQVGGHAIAPRYLWVAFALIASAPLVYLKLLVSPVVTWRGRVYRLDAASHLAVPERASAHPVRGPKAR